MESPFKTFLVPNEMCRRAGVSGTFISSNQLAVYPSQLVKSLTKDSPSPYTTNTKASIFQVRPEVILFHPILRRLVNESSGLFIKLQQFASKKQSDPAVDLLECSIQYRSVIRACLENLKEEVMRTYGPENQRLQNYVTIFYSVECIWHLCEILYLRIDPGNMLKMHLLEWVRFHIPKYERKLIQLLAHNVSTGLETNSEYWDTVVGCLLQGRIDEVRLLLEMHSNSSTNPFRVADNTLRTMPTYEMLHNVSMTEFNLRRKHWLLDTQSKIDGRIFADVPQINFIMRLIVGEERAWNEAQAKCEAWYELLAAWVFYTDPTLKVYELGRYAKKCISRMGTRMKHIDHVLLAAINKDIELMRLIQSMNENGWFVTHLTDLLFHGGHLDTWETNETSTAKLRESFILEYGTLLISHNSMWQIGLTYLDVCPSQGKGAIELMLPRVATNETKAVRVIREASKRGLHHIVKSISRIRSLHYIKHKRPGNALIWSLKIHDSDCISYIATQYLKEYKTNDILSSQDLLENLGSCMLANDNLIFLGKYYDYRRLFDSQKYTEAADVIVSLIGSKFTPKFFWDVLLTDTLSMLECRKPVVSTNATLIILKSVEERGNQSDLQDKMAMLRLALARNLSNVFTQDTQRAAIENNYNLN